MWSPAKIHMNKKELVEAVALRTGHTQKAVHEVISSFQSVVTDTLSAGDSVALVGFGTFSTTDRAERIGRNPTTGEPLTIPARKSIRFKAGQILRDKVQ